MAAITRVILAPSEEVDMARIGIALTGVVPIKNLLELATEADERGYHSLWLTEGSGREAFT